MNERLAWPEFDVGAASNGLAWIRPCQGLIESLTTEDESRLTEVQGRVRRTEHGTTGNPQFG